MSEQETIDRQNNKAAGGPDRGEGTGAAPKVSSTTPENKQGQVNPSAPEDSNVTPGSIEQK